MRYHKFNIAFLTLLLSFGACKKKSNTGGDNSTLTSDLAYSTVGASVSSNGYGLTSQINDAIPTSQNSGFGFDQGNSNGRSGLEFSSNHILETSSNSGNPVCSYVLLDTISRVSASSSSIKFDLKLWYSYSVQCANNLPTGLVFIDSTTGMYNGPRINFKGSSNGNFIFTNVSKADTALIINGTYAHNGMTIYKVGRVDTFNVQTFFTLDSLTIGKTTHFISKGLGTITVTGTSTKGGSFNYTGTIDFTTPGKLGVIIKGVKRYYDLITGNDITGS